MPQVSYQAMVEQLVAFGFSRAQAEAKAREEHGVAPIGMAAEQLQAHEDRLEKTIVAEADKQMRTLGFRVINTSQPRHAKYITPGVPDRFYFHRARGIGLMWEAKTATGDQSPAQKDFQDDVDACGWPYVLGTDQALYAWLIDHHIAVRDGEYLISTTVEQERRTA